MNAFFSAIEAKVKASTTAATITAAVLGLLGAYVWHGALPPWVEVIVDAAVTGGLAFAAGWLAKHTPRADVPPPAVAPAVPATPAVPPGPAAK